MPFEWGLFSAKGLESIEQSDARINLWEGAVRSSKTICSLVRWLDYVRTGPPGDYLMVGKTERTLQRNILNPLKEIVGAQRCKYNRGMGEVYLPGRRIYVAGANDERAAGKIQGLTLAGAYGDELTLWPESFFAMLLSRLSVAGAKFFGTANPDSPYHWLKINYLDRVGELDLKHWHFDLGDNLNLDPAYVAALKKEYVGLWYKRFILGLWVLAEGAIYDMWDEGTHVVDAPKDLPRHIVAIDYGTANPCTFGLYSFGRGPEVYLGKEYWYDSAQGGRQKTDSEYADDFKEWLGEVRPEAIYVDPSAASFIAELKKRSFSIRDADNSVLDGIRFVSGTLTKKHFLVDRSCVHTAKEFASYTWDPKAQLKGEDKPLKQNDHTMDRNRYALFSHFGKSVTRAIGQRPRGW